MILLLLILLLCLICNYYFYKKPREGNISKSKKKIKRKCKKKYGKKNYILIRKKRKGKTKWVCKKNTVISSKKRSLGCKGKCCKYKDEENYNISCDKLKTFCARKIWENNQQCVGVGIDCFDKLKEMKC